MIFSDNFHIVESQPDTDPPLPAVFTKNLGRLLHKLEELHQRQIERVHIGAMLEVPSLLFQLDELLERVDFLSVGSNDLMQFMYAADRGNMRVATRFDILSAPVLRALKDIADKARQYGKPVALCGEMASQPIGAMALAILGYRTMSLTPSAVGPVKAMLLGLDCKKGADILLPVLAQPVGSVPIRARLEEFAQAEGLSL